MSGFAASLASWSVSAKQRNALCIFAYLASHIIMCLSLFWLFVFFFRKGSVIADMELTFNQKVGSSEVETLLSEVTKDGKMGNLEISRVVSDGLIEGQLLFTSVFLIVFIQGSVP